MDFTEANSEEPMTDAGNQDNAAQSPDNGTVQHKLWKRELDLTIYSIGYSVGIANLWRFPFIAYINGGGAFLVPYLIIVLTIGFPLYLMELFLGQLSHLDPLNVWKFCPFFTGVGYSIMINTAVILIYYNVLQMYGLFYLLQSLRSSLPWGDCLSWWGADSNCYQSAPNMIFCDDVVDKTGCTNATQSSSEQFWKKYVLGLSPERGDSQIIKWDLALLLLAIWCICFVYVIVRYYRVIPSIRISIGYFTALFPLAVISVLCVYAFYQKDALEKLKKLLAPKWSSLLEINVWAEAAQQCVYSLGLGQGGLIVLGCRNRVHYNFNKCAIIATLTDTVASILAAVNTFIIAGVLYAVINLDYNEYTLSGIGLVFVTYPEALNTMSIPGLWSIVFFFMYITLTIDSAIGMLQTVALSLHQCFPQLKKNAVIPVCLVCTVLYLVGLSCVTKAGIYVLHLLDAFSTKALLGITAAEAVAFGWGYGTKRITDDVKALTGFKLNIVLKLAWNIISPFLTIVLFIFSLTTTQLPPLYQSHYPAHANVVGWFIVILCIMPIPVCMLISVVRNKKDLRRAFEPYRSWVEATSKSRIY